MFSNDHKIHSPYSRFPTMVCVKPYVKTGEIIRLSPRFLFFHHNYFSLDSLDLFWSSLDYWLWHLSFLSLATKFSGFSSSIESDFGLSTCARRSYDYVFTLFVVTVCHANCKYQNMRIQMYLRKSDFVIPAWKYPESLFLRGFGNGASECAWFYTRSVPMFEYIHVLRASNSLCVR